MIIITSSGTVTNVLLMKVKKPHSYMVENENMDWKQFWMESESLVMYHL